MDWKRLGRLARDRRKALGLAQRDLKALGGPSVVTVRFIERGARSGYRDGTLRDLERALKWADGSAQAILSGADPTAVDDGQTGDALGGVGMPGVDYRALFAKFTADTHAVEVSVQASEVVRTLMQAEGRGSASIIDDALAAYLRLQSGGAL